MPVWHSSFCTHVPSLPGEYSHDCPTFWQAAGAAGAGAFLSSGGHPSSAKASNMQRAATFIGLIIRVCRGTLGSMLRQRLLHVLAYLPLIVLALSAIVTMTQVGCSGTSTGGYGYGFSGSSGYLPRAH